MPSFRIRDCELGIAADIELGHSALKIEISSINIIFATTANQSLTENLGPNGSIGRRQQKLSTITN